MRVPPGTLEDPGVNEWRVHIRPIPRLDADVLIAGAGPAGAALAATLSRAGVRVLLLDKAIFPRDKICGDFVGPVALQVLDTLGLTTHPTTRAGNVIREATLYLDGRHLVTSAIPRIDGLASFGRTIRRTAFDDMLFRAATAAGARTLEGYPLETYEVREDCVRVRVKHVTGLRTLTARLLVGADGSNSTVAAILRGRRPARADRIIAVRAYYEDVVEGPADRAELYFAAESFPGYTWVFPTPGGSANVGVGMVLDTIPTGNEHLREMLLHLMRSDPALRRRLGGAQPEGKVVGWPLSTFRPGAPVLANRVLLIGDAAGLINPLNGEGIQYALQSAGWAADTILRALAADELSAAGLRPYEQRLAAELRYDMALARLLVRAISNRALNAVWLRALRAIAARARRDATYARTTGGVLAGLVPAREVLSPRVLYGTLEEGVMLLVRDALLGLLPQRPAQADRARGPAAAAAAVALAHAREPVAAARWAAQLGLAGVDLLAQSAKSAMASAGGHKSRSTM